MKWNYTCRRCGCNIDPGEGQICDECRSEEENLNKWQQSSRRTYSRNTEKLIQNKEICIDN